MDVMIGNEEDFTACLGFEIEGNDENLKELNLDGYNKMRELFTYYCYKMRKLFPLLSKK
mgnify:CR=1 FL=1